jgi:CRISPR-associated endonuclease Cas3-HD
MNEYFAHSPDKEHSIPAQTYARHVAEVSRLAAHFSKEVCSYASLDGDIFTQIVECAALYHDLGKLDRDNQLVLEGKKSERHLPINHVDAGAAYGLQKYDNGSKENSYWIVSAMIQAHHRGFKNFNKWLDENDAFFRDSEISKRTDSDLDRLLNIHRSLMPERDLLGLCKSTSAYLSVFLRVALSCLADADHTDSAVNYHNCSEYKPQIALEPTKRLKQLDEYVSNLAEDNERSRLRQEMYLASRDRQSSLNISSCDSPVGSGKTTAIMAHLLRKAETQKLRRIFVVLPFTNIITQSVNTYREALVFPGENPEEIVAELHHRADFSNLEIRHLTALWRAPIVVTTALAFFETLASNSPAALRRLHELPGSAIFVDESHAALPPRLLPLAWRWINVYAKEWSCYWLLASGSLTRFWEIDEIKDAQDYNVLEILDDDLRNKLQKYEKARIKFCYDLAPKNVEELANWITSFIGPRLVIMNTVQSAAVLADYFENRSGRNSVEHLSTALTPIDREETLKRVRQRLKNVDDNNWTLIATSCVEAGVNISFRNGFRELCSLLSLLQTSGRVNRGGEYNDSQIWSFKISETGLFKAHPQFKDSAEILKKYFEDGESISPDLSTRSIRDELIRSGKTEKYFKKLLLEEKNLNFPMIEEEFKVINADTRLVAVDKDMIEAIKNHKAIDWSELQKKSVRIWGYKLEKLRISEIAGGIYEWDRKYDSFLGVMSEILKVEKFTFGETTIY